jgi:hypothetical protein
MQLILVYGRYPDCARSEPPLAAEGNFNPKCAQEGLCPAQPTSEYAGAFWPARPVGADQQKVRCASPPLRSVDDELTHVDFVVASGVAHSLEVLTVLTVHAIGSPPMAVILL